MDSLDKGSFIIQFFQKRLIVDCHKFKDKNLKFRRIERINIRLKENFELVILSFYQDLVWNQKYR
jgi:hypothetical protein